ncbi:hypothetical protein ACOAJ8_06710 [Arcobacter cryaerophilus gv. pseudocryaerophilus]
MVVNFGEDINPFDNISSLKFAFDLDSDGKDELIPYLKAGAGYLVLDKNLNGKIDRGKELLDHKQEMVLKSWQNMIVIKMVL